jgi:hypothetical protein
MPENPRYAPMPVEQPLLFDANGIHVGYTVAVKLKKGEIEHTESVDVVVGAEAAAQLAAGDMTAYTTWNKSQVDAHDLIAKANAALDGT